MLLPTPPTISGLTSVLDSNVVVEIWSIHDLTKVYDDAHALSPAAAAADPDVRYRRQRIADGLRLAVALHETSAKTFVLIDECIRLTEERVPPTASTFEREWIQIFSHFVKEHVLPRWDTPGEPGLDANIRGDDCDDLLIEAARINNVPIVTNEGVTSAGIFERRNNVRVRARAAGVQPFSPAEYVAHLKFEIEPALRAFEHRFVAELPAYVAQHPTPREVEEFMQVVAGAYSWCLSP